MEKIIIIVMAIGSFYAAKAQNMGTNTNTINTNTINTNIDPTIPLIKTTSIFPDCTKSLYPDTSYKSSIPAQKQNPYTLPNDVKGIRKDSLQKQKRDHR